MNFGSQPSTAVGRSLRGTDLDETFRQQQWPIDSPLLLPILPRILPTTIQRIRRWLYTSTSSFRLAPILSCVSHNPQQDCHYGTCVGQQQCGFHSQALSSKSSSIPRDQTKADKWRGNLNLKLSTSIRRPRWLHPITCYTKPSRKHAILSGSLAPKSPFGIWIGARHIPIDSA